MTKIILIMYLCSSIVGNNCVSWTVPQKIFNDHYDCMIYAYDYTTDLLSKFERKWVNEMGAFTRFTCKVELII